jgi:hypothetical protein
MFCWAAQAIMPLVHRVARYFLLSGREPNRNEVTWLITGALNHWHVQPVDPRRPIVLFSLMGV